MIKPYFETKLGKLYHGNCIDIMKQLETKSVDLILTDPPYGVNLKYDTYQDTEDNWYKLFEAFMPQFLRLAKMSIFPTCQIKKMPYIYSKYPPDWLIAWYKGSPGHRSYIGFNDWEPLLVYGKNDGVIMHDYFYCQTEGQEQRHPCPKSVKWAKWLIKRATKEGQLVLDPFLGSGTTAIACEKLGRRWIGIELSEDYCGICVRRIEDEAKQGKLFFE